MSRTYSQYDLGSSYGMVDPDFDPKDYKRTFRYDFDSSQVLPETMTDEEERYLKDSTARIAKRLGANGDDEPLQNYIYRTSLGNFGAVGNRWTFTLLNAMVQGTIQGTRIGRQIWMSHLTFSTGAPTVNTRMCLVYDKQSNGAAMTGLDVFQEQDDIRSPPNWDNRERFDILMDSLYDVNENDYWPISYPCVPIQRTTSYNSGNAGDITDIASGALWIGWYTANAPGTAMPGIALMLHYEE